jgi:hypothetical protein
LEDAYKLIMSAATGWGAFILLYIHCHARVPRGAHTKAVTDGEGRHEEAKPEPDGTWRQSSRMRRRSP